MAEPAASEMRPDGMPRGKPFAKGDGRPRGNQGNSTAKQLARARRRDTIAALVQQVQANATSSDPEVMEQVRATAELLLRYSDGEPGSHNVPSDLEERGAAAQAAEEIDVNPPALGEEEAA